MNPQVPPMIQLRISSSTEYPLRDHQRKTLGFRTPSTRAKNFLMYPTKSRKKILTKDTSDTRRVYNGVRKLIDNPSTPGIRDKTRKRCMGKTMEKLYGPLSTRIRNGVGHIAELTCARPQS